MTLRRRIDALEKNLENQRGGVAFLIDPAPEDIKQAREREPRVMFVLNMDGLEPEERYQ